MAMTTAMLPASHQRRQRRPGPWSLAAATLTAFLTAGFDGATTGILMHSILQNVPNIE